MPGGKAFTESTILSPPVEGARAGQASIAVTVRDPYDDGPVSGATVTVSLDGVNTSKTGGATAKSSFPGWSPARPRSR